MKRILCALLAVILCLLCISCSADKDSTAEEESSALSKAELKELEKYLRSLSENYVTSDDGKTVSVTVPDFTALIDEFPALRSPSSATADVWKNITAKNPDLVKEYVLYVESADADTVYKALWEQINIELFVAAVGEVTLDFSDPYERGETEK